MNTEMKIRYDMKCPHRNCGEPIVEITSETKRGGFTCKKHGPVTPGISRESNEQRCPKCGGTINLIAPEISKDMWSCENCGPVYPEPEEREIIPEKSEPPTDYNTNAGRPVWDGEGP